MPIATSIKANFYKDSVALMRIGQVVLTEGSATRATLLMGTPANKQLLLQAGLFRDELEAARANDLMIVVEAATEQALEAARGRIAALIGGEREQQGSARAVDSAATSISIAKMRAADADLVQISVPGAYAAAEALKALKQGMHVFLFSNNVPMKQELELKRFARDRDLLVMGPDCGTAIIRGVPLGFANVARRGCIGLVGASGTGLQEVVCRVHGLGEGVSHAIGTGGRDVRGEIGGITMIQAIDLLAADPDTRVIAIVSKPPAPEVARLVLDHAARSAKPCVVLFLGADPASMGSSPRIVPVSTLLDAASVAVALARTGHPPAVPQKDDFQPLAMAEARRLAPGQHFLRGMYSGGTFCTEAQVLWRLGGMRVKSNVPLEQADALGDITGCASHCAVDFGTDEFTVGRPHPMIDMTTRIEALLREAANPSVAVLTLDVVLGYGSHDDPAGVLAPAIAAAKTTAVRDGRHLSVVSFVCGTEGDPQGFAAQHSKLSEAGAVVATSSTAAARLGAAIALAAARTKTNRGDIAHSRQ